MIQLNESEQQVYDLIVNCKGRITQREIAREAPKLGSDAKHEGYISMDSTLRRIRGIVRDLIMKHGLNILSDKKGYYIKKSDEEAREFMDRFERQAKAAARAYMQRYRVMSRQLGIQSNYFEQQGKLFE